MAKRVLKPKTGKFIKAEAVRFNRNGTVTVKTRSNPRNVQAGFYDATGFHPLRASSDYDPDRAGDDYESKSDNKSVKRRTATKKSKTKTKKRAKR